MSPTRQILLTVALVLVVVTAAAVVLVVGLLRTSPPPERTGFGFTVSSSSDPYGSWAAFTADVDLSAARGLEWVRLGIASWLVAPSPAGADIGWDEHALAVYDREIDYIRSRGLRVFLVTSGAPDWTQGASSAEYARVSAAYWSHLAQRFAPRVAVWQVFNEADSSDYRTFRPLDRPDRRYTRELAGLLRSARTIVHDVAPGVVVTTNSTGFPVDDRREAIWTDYFAALAPSLDAVTLDLYPTDDPGQIASLPDRVARAEQRFRLPVYVGEVGLQTCRGCWSEETQGRAVGAAVAALRTAHPRAVLVYEMRDGGPDTTDGESTFGVVALDGRRKTGFDRILAQMTPEPGP
ncbi:cellulase family glycosylhydrolase [Actinomycetospora chiangmaiensis]|uniref:cellulase family glycosylhydrolase n=1 Tax=Actinomycetospora chiangmaiensis TaxID=402650 RepID=UPI00037B16D8|nr:cellulase family glycosylhydrolase [Actinomycetospora chiangmaiensis]